MTSNFPEKIDYFLNENKNDWDEINPEVLFGTEQPSYKSFS